MCVCDPSYIVVPTVVLSWFGTASILAIYHLYTSSSNFVSVDDDDLIREVRASHANEDVSPPVPPPSPSDKERKIRELLDVLGDMPTLIQKLVKSSEEKINSSLKAEKEYLMELVEKLKNNSDFF